MLSFTGRAKKSQRKDKLEWSLFKAFFNRFQEIFLYMEDRHHFYMHTDMVFLIWSRNAVTSDRSDLSFRSDLSARPVQYIITVEK